MKMKTRSSVGASGTMELQHHENKTSSGYLWGPGRAIPSGPFERERRVMGMKMRFIVHGCDASAGIEEFDIKDILIEKGIKDDTDTRVISGSSRFLPEPEQGWLSVLTDEFPRRNVFGALYRRSGMQVNGGRKKMELGKWKCPICLKRFKTKQDADNHKSNAVKRWLYKSPTN